MSISKRDIPFFLTLTVVACCLVFQVWRDLRPVLQEENKGERRPCSDRLASFYGEELKKIAAGERMRAWKEPGLESDQACWLAAKADYALYSSKFGKGKELSAEARFLLEDTYEMLLIACEQSRMGVKDIREESGARLRAYISPIDQTLQTYSVAVPANYDNTRAYPLLVSMHGHAWYRPFQGHPAPLYNGAICLSPYGRGATDYKSLGELDVMQAIAEVKKYFHIDENRVYLMGGSMGGTGAFHLGTHYADQFAGILPICGNADNEAWTKAWGWNKPFEGRNAAMRKWVQDSHTARAYAQNMINLPSYIVCGTGDFVVPPEHSRNMVKLLRHYHAPVQYREYLSAGHGGFSQSVLQDALSWVTSFERNPYPKNIYWKADSLRYGKAYWTRMEQFARPLASAYLYTTLKPEGLVFQTANLLSFSFQRPENLFLPTSSMVITIDKQQVTLNDLPKDDTAWITLRKDPIHGWRDLRELPQPQLIKKAGLEGPISDALEAPFLLVIGTSAQDPAMNQAWKREADTFIQQWMLRNNNPCLAITDKECTPELMQKYNLILLGDGRDNAVSEQVSKSMPVSDMLSNLPMKDQDPEDALNSPLDAPDLGYMLVYPNVEFAPHRLAVMLSANSPSGAFQLWGRFGNWFNWGVFDSKKYFDYACFDARSASPESMLMIGWFGTDWRVDSGKYFLGNEQIREQMAPQGYPALEQVPDGGDTLMLAELMPSSIAQMRGALGINRGFFGEKLKAPSSLGMRAPCAITYDIDGKYRRFTSDVTLLNSPETDMCSMRLFAEEVTFTLFGDDKKLASVKVTWNQPEAHIEADVTGVKQLKLDANCTYGPSWLHSGAAWITPALWKSALE